MRAFNANELTGLRGTQSNSMMDSCQIGVFSSTTNAYNEPVEDHTYGDEIDCGVETPVSAANEENILINGVVVTIDAVVRMSIANGGEVTPQDKIKITKRHGETLDTPEIYDVTGYPKRGPSGVRLQLSRVEI